MSSTAFKSINSTIEDASRMRDLQDNPNIPTTPRAGMAQIFTSQDTAGGTGQIRSTTSLNTDAADQAGQRPLPASPLTLSSHFENRDLLHERGTNNSAPSSNIAGDMDVDVSDNDQDGSDNDTENGEPGRMSNKKKKGQKFFCTDFPPCHLSFTRSEHLARHIRKHTGERPFQCHCNRRFSRLDNLRQHAQTVHVNEDIPSESLAATGTRYQRQIRTEKLRPAASRVRSSNIGGQNNHHRGHSRNLSASSIGSTASNYSTSESRRRPPPLLMATNGGARPRLALETPATPPSQYRGYSADSPGGMTTPTSATYSANPSSPGYGSFTESPVSANSRVANLYGNTAPDRRLSVPSSAKIIHSPQGHTQSRPYMNPFMSSTGQFVNVPGHFHSPASSHFSPPHTDETNPSAEAESRRRTWHPSSIGSHYSRPASSGLSFSQTPDSMQTELAPRTIAATPQPPRLPGIESFDRVQYRPSTPPRRQPSPMQIDNQFEPIPFANQHASYSTTSSFLDQRRGHFSWDGSHSARFARPDLQTSLSRDSSSWSQRTHNEIHKITSRPTSHNPPGTNYRPGQATVQEEPRQHTDPGVSVMQPSTPQQNKRSGRSKGLTGVGPQSVRLARTPPEDSSSSEGVPTPSTSMTEVHPAIMNSNGYVEPHPHHPPLSAQASQDPCNASSGTMSNQSSTAREHPARPAYFTGRPQPNPDMGRLEALVAVATSEDKAATVAR